MVRNYTTFLVGIIIFWGGCLQQPLLADNKLILAQDGRSNSIIVMNNEAPATVRHAADELALFLSQITGAAFDIVNTPSAAQTNIFVGPGAAKMADAGFTTDDLGEEGIIIRTTANGLILAGGEPRGTLYAVYSFLQDELGCRWWTSTAQTIPQSKTIIVDPLDICYVPPIEYRESFWFDSFDGDWSVRNKNNGHHARLKERQGGKHKYLGFVHTFSTLITPEKYFEQHPEWFSLIEGNRKGDKAEAQLCLTNEQMRHELIRNLKEMLHTKPEVTIASVSQNDGWAGNCQCAKCRVIEEEEGSPAGLMIRFVNSVAEEIEKDFPHVAIDTLAYTYTQKPPLHVRPRENVIVRLCNYKSSFARPLTDSRNKEFCNDLVNWSKICNRIYIWNYVTNFAHYIQPHPNLRVLGPNIKFFVDHHVKGIFEQGAYQSPGAEMAELRSWLIAQLLWNPELDSAKLSDEFVTGYYGPAAPHIKAYLDLIHEAVADTDDWLGCYSDPNAAFLSLETLSKGREHLNAAQKSVENNPDYLKRVDLARLPVMYVFLMRWNELKAQATEQLPWPIEDSIDGTFDEFMRIAKENKITHLNEAPENWNRLINAVERQKTK